MRGGGGELMRGRKERKRRGGVLLHFVPVPVSVSVPVPVSTSISVSTLHSPLSTLLSPPPPTYVPPLRNSGGFACFLLSSCLASCLVVGRKLTVADIDELPIPVNLQGLASSEGPRPARSPSCAPAAMPLHAVECTGHWLIVSAVSDVYEPLWAIFCEARVSARTGWSYIIDIIMHCWNGGFHWSVLLPFGNQKTLHRLSNAAVVC